MYKKEWLTPTDDLHKGLKLLQIRDIYKLFIWNFVYKRQTHCLPDAFHNYFMLRSEIHHQITRAIDIHIPKANNNFGYNSIKISGAKAYNQLPKDVRYIKTEKDFKNAVKMILLSNH